MHCSCSGPETGTVLVARPWGIGAILHKALDTLNNKIQSYGSFCVVLLFNFVCWSFIIYLFLILFCFLLYIIITFLNV